MKPAGGEGEEKSIWTLTKCCNGRGKWGRSNLWIDFSSEEQAKEMVFQHMSFYQPDSLLGGVQWNLLSIHFPVMEQNVLVESLGRLAIGDASRRLLDTRALDDTMAGVLSEVAGHMDLTWAAMDNVENSEGPGAPPQETSEAAHSANLAVSTPGITQVPVVADGAEKAVESDDELDLPPETKEGTTPTKAQGKKARSGHKRAGASPFKADAMVDSSPVVDPKSKRGATEAVAPRK
jgi:hypothetical protein